MVDTWGIGVGIGAVLLLLVANFSIHVGAYALLARMGWWHPPHHDDDEICACDLDDVREGRISLDDLRLRRVQWKSRLPAPRPIRRHARGILHRNTVRGRDDTIDINSHNDVRRK